MPAYILCALLLSVFSSQCSSDKPTPRSWAAVVQDGKKAAPKRLGSSQSQAFVSAPLPIDTFVEEINPITTPQKFVEKLYTEHTTGSALMQASKAFLFSDAPHYYKSWLCRINAAIYAREGNTSAEITCLCNELAQSYNSQELIDDSYIFPEYNLEGVHRLCVLLSLEKNLGEHSIDDPDFLEAVYRSGRIAQIPEATLLLARSSKQTGDLTRAIFFYNELPETYAQNIRDEIIFTRIMETQDSDQAKLTCIFDEIIENKPLYESVITKLTEQHRISTVKLFWDYLFKKGQAGEKPQAAFELSKLLRETEPARADTYLALAASMQCLDASKEAYKLALDEKDTKRSMLLMEASARGNFRAAQENAGTFYRSLAIKQRGPERISSLQKAYGYLEAALKQNSALARLEMVVIPDREGKAKSADAVLNNLNQFIKNEASTVLRAKALCYEGKAWLLKADSPSTKKELDQYLKHAAASFKASADMDDSFAKLAYPSVLLRIAQETKNTKEQLRLAKQIEKLLTKEATSSTNQIGALAKLSQVHLLKKEFINSNACILEAYKLNVHNENTRSIITSNFELLRKQQQYSSMKDLAAGILDVNPLCNLAHFYLGVCAHEQDHNINAACEHLERAGQLGLADGYKNLGNLLGETAKTPDEKHSMLEAFKNALNINPNDPEIHRLIGHLQHELGQYVEAKAALIKGIGKGDPDCLSIIAHYWHKGLGGPVSLKHAAGFYALAATEFKKRGKIEEFKLCHNMHSVVQYQQIDLFTNPGNELVETTKKVFDELTELTRSSNPPKIINEALFTIACLYKHFAELYKNTKSKKKTYLEALLLIDSISDKEHTEATFLKAEIVRVLLREKLINAEEELPLSNLAGLSDLYEQVIGELERNRPLNPLLVDAYNAYAAHLRCNLNDKENAFRYSLKAAGHDSVEGMLNLSRYYEEQNNLTISRAWIEKAYATNPHSQFFVQPQEMEASCSKDA